MSDPGAYNRTGLPTGPGIDPSTESLRTFALVVYVLYALGLVTGVLTIAGIILAYLKRGAAAGTVYESHFRYAISTFWLSVIAWIVGGILTLVFVGWIVLALWTVWYVFRIIKGGLRAMNREPVF
jgi:uncharacterized membrane protein